jgi:hypothetical protein
MFLIGFLLRYLLSAIWLSPGGSSTVHVYTQTIHTNNTHKQYTEPIHRTTQQCRCLSNFLQYEWMMLEIVAEISMGQVSMENYKTV